MRNLIWLITFGLALFSCTPPGNPNFAPKEINPKNYISDISAATVLLMNSDFSRCSAFHVGNGVYVTAAHCMSENEERSIVMLEKGDFLQLGVELERDRWEDYAIVLSRPLAAAARLSEEEPEVGGRLAAIGFPGFLGGLMEVEDSRLIVKSNVKDLVPQVFVLTQDIHSGQSGGPTISLETGKVVGINTGSLTLPMLSSSTPQKSLGLVIPISKIKDKIQTYIKAAK